MTIGSDWENYIAQADGFYLRDMCSKYHFSRNS